MTKTQDQLLFAFYNKNDEVRVTDLHQGIVWGTQTAETALDERLINRFDYDGDYGTVLNRFLMQAAIGYPLTVHGTGGQTRAFIHIQDTVRCIELARRATRRARGERVRIFNQMTETHRVIDLAELVSRLTGAEIDLVDNPRKEAAENDLLVDNRQLLDLGLDADHPRGRACCARSPRSPSATPTAATSTRSRAARAGRRNARPHPPPPPRTPRRTAPTAPMATERPRRSCLRTTPTA